MAIKQSSKGSAGSRTNFEIKSDPIRVVDENGEMVGVIPLLME